MRKEYDLLVIGSGPGGYVAAIRAAQLNMSVALVEKDKLGGVCLHRGCIPSKTLIQSSEMYRSMMNSGEYGITCDSVNYDFSAMRSRAMRVVGNLYSGVQSLVKKNKIDYYSAEVSLMGASIFSPNPGSVSIKDNGEDIVLVAKNVILATGSSQINIPGLEVDHIHILNSDSLLTLGELPDHMVIVGGGVIAVEWACLLNNLGVSVTMVEKANTILPLEDQDIASELTKILKKKKVQIYTNAEVLPSTLKVTKDILHLHKSNIEITINHENQNKLIKTNNLLVVVGRKPNSNNLGLENTRIKVSHSGHIEVDKHFRTKEKHIFAIGDVVDFISLAHAASAAGVYVIEHLAGLHPYPLLKTNIPRCIYSTPQIASIGITEQEAKSQGYQIKVSKSNFAGNSKAIIRGEQEGFVKFIIDSKTDDLLGVHIVGADATELIAEASLAKILDATALDISKAIHPHPSINENFMEAALSIYDRAIHK